MISRNVAWGPLAPGRFSMRAAAIGSAMTLAATWGRGAGRPILFLHPNRTNRRVFDFVLAGLPLGNTLIVPEYRGHGDSSRPTAGYGLEDHLRDLLVFVEACRLDRMAIVGQGTGATLGLLLATALGDRVAALALGNLAIAIPPAINTLVQRQVAEQLTFTDRQAAMHATPFAERWTDAVQEHWLDTALEPRPGGRLGWRYHAAGVAETEAALLADLWPSIAVTVPVLLFRGAQSDIIGMDAMDRARAALPQADFRNLDGANHRLSQDAPEAFAGLVADFFKRTGWALPA